MLGSLARWLRFFGFDSVFLEPGPEDRLLSEQARAEGRWLLTKDRELASAGPRTVLVRADDLDDQLIEVFTRLGLQPDATLERARCSECNGESRGCGERAGGRGRTAPRSGDRAPLPPLQRMSARLLAGFARRQDPRADGTSRCAHRRPATQTVVGASFRAREKSVEDFVCGP